jgi:arylsulfatase A-like enzyme
LKTLDSLGLSKNTIIVLWGDHGWHLGDHNLWCKHTNFEQAARAPLLIFAPGIKASKSESPSEFIDIFPTLCDLAGVSIPGHLDGKSLVSVMKNPDRKVKDYAVSQYPRTRNQLDSERLGWSDGQFMGYSVRTEKYRYTLWLKNNFRSNMPFREDLVVASELYDYKKDPDETVNVVADSKYARVSKEMHEKMIHFLSQQSEKLNRQ